MKSIVGTPYETFFTGRIQFASFTVGGRQGGSSDYDFGQADFSRFGAQYGVTSVELLIFCL